jgi:hypothetical protein
VGGSRRPTAVVAGRRSRRCRLRSRAGLGVLGCRSAPLAPLLVARPAGSRRRCTVVATTVARRTTLPLSAPTPPCASAVGASTIFPGSASSHGRCPVLLLLRMGAAPLLGRGASVAPMAWCARRAPDPASSVRCLPHAPLVRMVELGATSSPARAPARLRHSLPPSCVLVWRPAGLRMSRRCARARLMSATCLLRPSW